MCGCVCGVGFVTDNDSGPIIGLESWLVCVGCGGRPMFFRKVVRWGGGLLGV